MTSVEASLAEAAPDDAVSGGDSPPSTPAAATSGVASAGVWAALEGETWRGVPEEPSTPLVVSKVDRKRGVVTLTADKPVTHPWRRGRAVSARRVPGGRAE